MNKFNEFFMSVKEVYVKFLVSFADLMIRVGLAVVLVLVGLVVANIVKKAVRKSFKGVDGKALAKSLGVEDIIEKSGYKINVAKSLSIVVKWLILVAFGIGALEILKLDVALVFLGIFLNFLSKIIAAAVIFALAFLSARFISSLVKAFNKMVGVKYGHLMAKAASAVIYFIALVIVLDLFAITQIVGAYVALIVQSVALAVSVAFGLAFGLGGKEAASKAIEEFVRKMK